MEHPIWLPVAQAARALGITQQAVRRRIQRGTLPTRRELAGNRSRILVRVEQPGQHPVGHPVGQRVEHPVEQPPDSPLVAELRARIEALERRLDEGHAERDKLLTMIAELQSALAERRAPERRPWPGLRAWWRRLWEGEG